MNYLKNYFSILKSEFVYEVSLKGERPYIKESEPKQIRIRHENSVSPCSIESFDSWNLFFHFWNASSRNQHLGVTSFSPSFLFVKNGIHCTFKTLTLIRYSLLYTFEGWVILVKHTEYSLKGWKTNKCEIAVHGRLMKTSAGIVYSQINVHTYLKCFHLCLVPSS